MFHLDIPNIYNGQLQKWMLNTHLRDSESFLFALKHYKNYPGMHHILKQSAVFTLQFGHKGLSAFNKI
jgi:hypothetical protein